MSAHPNIQTPADASRLPVTLPRLFEKKRLGEPIVMVTAYDFPSARAAEEAGVDLVLVGDSGAMTVLGYPSTVAVELDELLVLARATRRDLASLKIVITAGPTVEDFDPVRFLGNRSTGKMGFAIAERARLSLPTIRRALMEARMIGEAA